MRRPRLLERALAIAAAVLEQLRREAQFPELRDRREVPTTGREVGRELRDRVQLAYTSRAEYARLERGDC